EGVTVLGFAGGTLRTAAHVGPPGARLRMRLRARDVAVATVEPRGLSTSNILPVTLAAILDAPEPAEAFLRLAAGPSVLLARVTRESVQRLELRQGMPLWALVKAVTIDHRGGPPA
ncbi:TOBE domain-containing protein, partial [Neoroseomonas rubea]|uniref:TOBE domain-containing protein n=1 Tax=Neoroseomonas rubea TaxID=2748666 RepID=UPI0018E009A5